LSWAATNREINLRLVVDASQNPMDHHLKNIIIFLYWFRLARVGDFLASLLPRQRDAGL
jgi:hypothetical protein